MNKKQHYYEVSIEVECWNFFNYFYLYSNYNFLLKLIFHHKLFQKNPGFFLLKTIDVSSWALHNSLKGVLSDFDITGV